MVDLNKRYTSIQRIRALNELRLLGAMQSGSDVACAYVDGDKRCFVGALIPAEQVHRIDDNGEIGSVRNYSPPSVLVREGVLPDPESELGFSLGELSHLQDVHDKIFGSTELSASNKEAIMDAVLTYISTVAPV